MVRSTLGSTNAIIIIIVVQYNSAKRKNIWEAPDRFRVADSPVLRNALRVEVEFFRSGTDVAFAQACLALTLPNH